MKKLTKRQREVLDFIECFIDVHGYAPTFDEMADRFEVNKASVFYHVNVLIRKGYVAKTPGKFRTIRLVKSTEPKYVVEPGHVVIGNRTIKVGIPGTNIVKVK